MEDQDREGGINTRIDGGSQERPSGGAVDKVSERAGMGSLQGSIQGAGMAPTTEPSAGGVHPVPKTPVQLEVEQLAKELEWFRENVKSSLAGFTTDKVRIVEEELTALKAKLAATTPGRERHAELQAGEAAKITTAEALVAPGRVGGGRQGIVGEAGDGDTTAERVEWRSGAWCLWLGNREGHDHWRFLSASEIIERDLPVGAPQAEKEESKG